jgi:NADPH:quinone reductase-like Zn-dependent oxidoreductase
VKAVVFHRLGGPEVLTVEDVPVPEIGPDDVLVRVRAVSVNRTLDIDVRTWGATWPIPFPHILGADPAGDVAAVGASVRGFEPGDRVVTNFVIGCGACEWCLQAFENACPRRRLIGVHRNGGYAEYVPVPSQNLVRIPSHLNWEQASAIMVIFPVAWHLLIDRARLQAGETVLVMAAGGALGMAGLQIAKLAGARVIAAASAAWKLDRARELGADEVVNYRDARLGVEVRRLTGGRGVDVVFENIASEGLWPESIASMANRGRLVTCGAHGGGRVPLDMNDFYRRHLSIISAAAAPRQVIDTVYRLAGEGKLAPHIHRTFALDRARAAHELVESRDVFGRVVLTVA